MKTIIRVFPRRTSFTPTDEFAFVGDPPMMRPEADEVHVSCAFTWDIERAKRLAPAWGQYYPVKIGGPAFDSPANGFIPGMYNKLGVTYTSRGCNNNCDHCLVTPREGRIRPYETFADGNIIQDNNFAQCPKEHRMKVYRMLERQSRGAEFTGGIQASLVTPDFAEEFKAIRINKVFLACDHDTQKEALKRAADLLSFLRRDKLFCYTMIGERGQSFGELLRNRRRLGFVWKAGCIPFAQLFQPADKWIDYHPTWKRFGRTFSRPAATKALMKQGER